MEVYAVQVYTGKETEVARRLRDCGIKVLPETRKVISFMGTKEEAVYPGYVLVEASDAIEAYHMVKAIPFAVTLFHDAPLSEVEVEDYLACARDVELEIPVNKLGTLSHAVTEVFNEVVEDTIKLKSIKPLLEKVRKVIYNPYIIGKKYQYRLSQALLECLDGIWQGGDPLLGLDILQE